METREYKVYKFHELPEDARQRAIEKHYDINVDYEWWDGDFDDFTTIAGFLGIDIDKIYFSGFGCQGDGACFEGYYQYKKGSVKAIKGYAPLDKELHIIAQELQELQRKYFYSITATVKQSGHYMHESCTSFDINADENYINDSFTEIEDGIKELLRDFMRWVYRKLEEQYYYLTSEESIIETIEANDYDFTIDGHID